MQHYRRIRFSFGWAATFWIQGLKDLGVFKGIFRVQSSDPPFCYKSLIMHKNKPMPRSMENPPEIQDSPKCFGLRPSWETLRKREETSEEVVVCDVFLVRARLIWRIPHRCDRNKIYTAIFFYVPSEWKLAVQGLHSTEGAQNMNKSTAQKHNVYGSFQDLRISMQLPLRCVSLKQAYVVPDFLLKLIR